MKGERGRKRKRKKAYAARAQMAWLVPAWIAELLSNRLGCLCFPQDVWRKFPLKKQML